MNDRRFKTPLGKRNQCFETTPVGKTKMPSSSIEKKSIHLMDVLLTQILNRFVENNFYS